MKIGNLPFKTHDDSSGDLVWIYNVYDVYKIFSTVFVNCFAVKGQQQSTHCSLSTAQDKWSVSESTGDCIPVSIGLGFTMELHD